LSRVQEPVACKRGHIFCRTCIIENLVNQKKQRDAASKRYEKELIDKSILNKAASDQKLL
jgi:nitric oxide synthase-interacting protein